ncbi:hypothetical protein KAU33_02550 [Candidatus Dependentiae bacterium]|nr:hypothetical protein [Candidatus Dependentiae bacterium]
MGLIIIGTVMLVLGLIMDHARNVSKENQQIWPITGVLFATGVLIEQIAIHSLGYNATEMIGQWTIGIWIFNMPIESLYLYLAFPYLILIIYYGYIKESVENKLLSPFKGYSR